MDTVLATEKGKFCKLGFWNVVDFVSLRQKEGWVLFSEDDVRSDKDF